MIRLSAEVRELMGKELSRTRRKAKLTIRELAVFVGKSPGVVSAIERGQVQATTRYIEAVCKACGREELWTPTTIPPAPLAEDEGRITYY